MDGLILQSQRELRDLNWTFHQHGHQFPHVPHSSIRTCNRRASRAFLSNCPLLERLYVSNSEDIVNLKIWGSTLRLKYLLIIQCSQFKSIEVFAPNLESFGLVGGIIETHVNYAPRLLVVHIGGCEPVKYAICLCQTSFLSYRVWC